MFHAVRITPEAPTLKAALGDRAPRRTHHVTAGEIREARGELSTFTSGPLDAVSVGTPHFSLEEIAALARAFGGDRVREGVEFYANTHRYTLEKAADRGLVEACERAGVRFVVDTCTYITSILSPASRNVMTDSAKWAYYAPGRRKGRPSPWRSRSASRAGWIRTPGRSSTLGTPVGGRPSQGKVLVMAAGRGSSSSSSVLAEAIRLGTAPVAIVLAEVDVIVALGAMAAAELYGIECPVVVVEDPEAFERVCDAGRIIVEARVESALVRLQA